MAKQLDGVSAARAVPTPPRMTRAEWSKRTKSKVTLTKNELDNLARTMAIGRAVLRDREPVPAQLKAAMTRLGVSTAGL